ncbi:MAG: hypothetical protein H6727_04115 [Myxococcales bacterium]|nr:hypothetical protein [Myxococcales bacterium]
MSKSNRQAEEKPKRTEESEKSSVSTQDEAVFVERSARPAWIIIGATFGLSLILALFSYNQLKASSSYIETSVREFGTFGKKLSVIGCAERAYQWNKQCTALKDLCLASLKRMVGACLHAQQRVKTCQSMNLGRNKGNFTFMRCKPKKLQRDREAKKACAYTYGAVWSYCHLVRRLKRKGISMPRLAPPAPQKR